MDDKISTFDSATEHSIRQITVDDNQGIAIRTSFGTNINEIPKGLKGVFVNPDREPLLIETVNDADHLHITKLAVDLKTGNIDFIGPNGSLSGKFVEPFRPYLASQTIENLDYDKEFDRFTITHKDGNLIYWSRFIDSIEVMEE